MKERVWANEATKNIIPIGRFGSAEDESNQKPNQRREGQENFS